MTTRRICSVIACAGMLTLPGFALGAGDDVPLANWAVRRTAPRPLVVGGDISGGTVFVAMAPCRIADTRGGAFTGAFGPPLLAGGAAARSFPILASACGSTIPANAEAYSLNFTAVPPGGTAAGGYLTVFPTGATQPVVSTMNFGGNAGVVPIANAAIVPAGTNGAVSTYVNFSTDLVIDVNGYFTNGLNAQEQLSISTVADGLAAVVGYNWSNADGSHGVGGYAGGTGTVHGVQGQIGATAGPFASGVHGISTNRDKSFAVLGDVAGYAGGSYFGTGLGAAVMGRGTRTGVAGYVNPPTTGTSSSGSVGVVLTSGTYVVDVAGTLGVEWQSTGEKYGVYYSGGLAGFGTKSFVEPHPTDPERVVRYYSLEGPESGTYCRGSAATKDGVATLELPDTFRWVTDTEGLTVQVTPTGADFVQVRVERKGLEGVVVRTSKDTTFDWVVQGVRRAYRDAEVTPRSEALRPEGPDARIPAFLSPDEQRRVIASGLYNPDGSVNLSTAQRLGWTREWQARPGAPPAR